MSPAPPGRAVGGTVPPEGGGSADAGASDTRTDTARLGAGRVAVVPVLTGGGERTGPSAGRAADVDSADDGGQPDLTTGGIAAVSPAPDGGQPAPNTSRVAVIVPAAGRGERLGPGAPKALRELGGAPLLVHAVRNLLAARTVDVVCVAAPPTEEGVGEVRALLSPLSAESGKDVRVTAGGATRQESVAKALAGLPADCSVVLVHDAARALTPVELIEAVVAAVRSGHAAVIPVLPVADTIKSVDGDLVTATVDRSRLRAVQTPQGFARDVLEKAHAGADPEAPATDDAGLVEALGLPVHTVPGHAEAFKVTTPFDLVVAEAVLDRIRRRP